MELLDGTTGGEGSPKTILLVEDELLVAMKEASILEKEGYSVIHVPSAQEAIETVRLKEVDLVLMDINLGRGRMDGTEAARIILEEKDLPIVFLSGHSEKGMVDRVKSITKYGYVLKTAGEFVLLESTEMAFALFEAQEQLKSARDEYLSVVELTGDIINRVDKYGRWVFVNSTACNFWGKSEEELKKSEYLDFVHPEDRAKTLSAREVMNDTKEPVYGFTNRQRTPRGWRTVKWNSTPILDEEGEAVGFQATGRDVTEEAQTEEKLHRITEKSPVGFFYLDKDLRIIYENPKAREIVGVPGDAGKSKAMDVDIRSIETLTARIEPGHIRRLLEGEAVEFEIAYSSLYGKESYLRIYAVPLMREKSFDGAVVMAEDISERNRMEKELKRSNEEKDFLLKELNHRVKNNLLMVSSLINLKDGSLGESIDLSDISHQIDAIRIVHEKLHESEKITHIDFKDYVLDLLTTVFTFSRIPVTVKETIEHISVRTKTAIPLGLIVNEIATNAIKHGFEGDTAEFSIRFSEDGSRKEYVLILENSGKPFPGDIDIDNPDTLGLKLISALVNQLGGTLELTRKPRPLFVLRFPID